MIEPLGTWGRGMGQAYVLTAIIGDHYCTCGRPVLLKESLDADAGFVGQCECGRIARCHIELARDGRSGVWVEKS